MIRRLLTLLVSAILFYVLYLYGVSYVNSSLIVAQPDQTPPLWELQEDSSFLSSRALVVRAQQFLKGGDVAQAKELALTALSADPSNGRAASLLLELFLIDRKTSGLDALGGNRLASLSQNLWPAHTYTRRRLAEYWAKEDRLDKVIDEWNVLLIRDSRIRKALFPLMAELIQNNRAAGLFQKFVDSPPKWWESFFVYLSRNIPVENLRLVYSARMVSDVDFSERERTYYVNRLMREKLWDEAYDTWFVGLSRVEARYAGFIFDGGFESGTYNEGFSWRFSRSKNPLIRTGITYGIKGRKALKVVLRGKEPINFRHISQRLFLSPGVYELSLRYRADSFKAQKGLAWRIHCLDGQRKTIVETDAISSVSPWVSMKANFEVDTACSAQQLILESTSKFRHEQSMTGSLWFDDIVIRKNTELL